MNFSTLNTNQLEAVKWTNGPMLVLAGPGSGKTKVLTVRAARILEEDPDASILALTFTAKAADEMRERLESLLGGRTSKAHLSTFHSFSGDILRQFGSQIGIRPDFSVLTTDEDRLAFLEAIIHPTNSKDAPAYVDQLPSDLKNLLSLIDRLFAESYDGGNKVPGLAHPPAWVEPLFSDYCGALIKANRFDFGAILHMARQLLSKNPSTARVLRYGWTHICVDEFQDTNKAQYDLLSLVVRGGDDNLFVVADDDQILYQWNGASPERLLALQDDFMMSRIQLPRNYRCPAEIIELANKLIVHNSTRTPAKLALVADRPHDQEARLFTHCYEDEMEEAKSIPSLITARGLIPNQCVVLARTARVIQGVSQALREAGFNVWNSQRKNEFETAPIRWLHSVLRLANQRHDREFVRRICVAWKAMGNSLVEVDNVEAQAALHGGDLLRGWLDLAMQSSQASILRTVRQSLAERIDFTSLLEEFWNDHASEEDPSIQEEIKVWKELDSALRNRVSADDLTLNHYLQEMDLQSKAPPRPDDAIPCITVHGSKGGEFDHVFLVGMAEEVFPSFQAVRKGDTSPELEEERRSCFVAITRVQKTLTVTWANRYNGYRKSPSRFLGEMGLV